MEWRSIIEVIFIAFMIILGDRFWVIRQVVEVLIKAVENNHIETQNADLKLMIRNYAIGKKVLDPLNQILINMELRDPQKEES